MALLELCVILVIGCGSQPAKSHRCLENKCECFDRDTIVSPLKSCPLTRRRHARVVNCGGSDILRVPDNISESTNVLLLANNKIMQFSAETLINMTQLECLDLTNNKLRTISAEPFQQMPNLTKLSLSGNHVGVGQLLDVVCHLQTEKVIDLDLINTSISRLSSDLLACLERLHLNNLDISGNNLGHLETGVLSKLTSLTVLSMADTNQPQFNPSALLNLSHLTSLRIQRNRIIAFPTFTIGASKEPILRNLRSLDLTDNFITHVDPDHFRGLLHLEHLGLRQNLISSLSANMFKELPRINDVSLESNPLKQIDVDAFNSGSLTYLTLLGCKFIFKPTQGKLFWNTPQMQTLILQKNYLGPISQSPNFRSLFQKLSKLTKLILSSIGVKDFPGDMFVNQTKLTKLYLSGNYLTELRSTWFQNLDLQSLYIDYNIISNINRSSFPPHILHRLKVINFAYNPFRCNCDLLWLRQWMNATDATIRGINDKRVYTCNSPAAWKGKELAHFNPTEAECIHGRVNLVLDILLPISGLLLLAIIIGSVIYRYRWNINYVRFLVRARRRQYRELHNEKKYVFDAFVSYNRAELRWVKDELLAKLENEEGLRLCIHDRDWVLGVDIMDNMVASIDNSRKIVLVVSNAFAQSQWCQMEMTLAQHRLLDEDRNALILVVYETVLAKHMTPRLAFQMKSQTYIEWTADEVGRKLFWMKLKAAIRKPSSSIMDSPDVRTR